jgi:hypothetical protein
MMTRSVLLPVTMLCALGFSGCAQNDDSSSEPVDGAARVGLLPFASCEDVLAYVHEEAAEQVGPYGFEGDDDWGWGAEGDAQGGGEDGGSDPAGDGGGDGGGGNGSPDFSETNVQEAGVDEPDVVKTDGERVLALAQGALHYVDMTSGDPVLRGNVALQPTGAEPEYGYSFYGAEMLVNGDRVIVVASRDIYGLPAPVRTAFGYGDYDYNSVTQLIEIDVSDPDAPAIVGNLFIEGSYASGRKIDDVARFVVRSFPRGLAFKYPYDFLQEEDYSEVDYDWDEAAYAAAERQAEIYNQSIVKETTLDHWLPRFVYEDLRPGAAAPQVGRLVDCERAYKPGAFAGFGMLSVLTVDLDAGLALGDAVGVFSEGETVYASTEGLYVATWPQYENLPEPGVSRTDDTQFQAPEILSYVHKFDISDPTRAEYRASGAVPGHLLDQWAMSEHAGDLRVATTDWGWWNDHSQSYVSVLRERGSQLELIGQVDGIGIDEQIFGVRLMGDKGYVVTFEQTDPLFTLDLSEPTDPRVVGELEMPGYSAYLHPIDDDTLIGIGREGDEDGVLSGAGINLFDVSDPANPVRLHHATFGDGWASSSVEWDHRAFLYWPAEHLVVIPVVSWGEWDEATQTQDYFAGAVAYRVDAESGISLAGIIENEPLTIEDEWGYSYGGEIQRALVVGDELLTLSESGLQATEMQGMTQTHWLPF